MKYSEEQLSELKYKDYILLMAKELNDNGYTDDNGKPYSVSTNVHGDFVSDFSIGFVLSLKDPKAVDFLKEIGLLNNGRCPLTGLLISNGCRRIYTSENSKSITFEINTAWDEANKVKRNWGCLLSPIIIIIGIVLGCMNNFDSNVWWIIGGGISLFVLSGLYGGANFGNNLNKSNLANSIGVNSITVQYILKTKFASTGRIDSDIVKYGICLGDLKAFRGFE